MYCQKKLLDDIISNEDVYKKAAKIVYAISGRMAINSFAITRLKDLQVFYSDMIDKLEKDRFAFIKEQLSWLELKSDEVEEVIEGAESKYREYLRNAIEELVNKKITTEENKKFKVKYRASLEVFLRKVDGYTDKEVRKVTRADGTIVPEIFNKIMNEAKLPYLMHKDGKSAFIIEQNGE